MDGLWPRRVPCLSSQLRGAIAHQKTEQTMTPKNDWPVKAIPDLMTVADVSKRLKASISFVYARIADGSLPHYRLGDGQGGLRVSEEQLAHYLRSRQAGPTAV